MSVLVGAPAPRVYARKTLSPDAMPLTCGRVSTDAFLSSFDLAGEIEVGAAPRRVLMPILVCNRDAPLEEYRSRFAPVAEVGRGGFGTVWLYRKEKGPSVADEVCLKVIRKGAAEEAEAIRYINGRNAAFVGLEHTGCEVINARVLRLAPDGQPSYVLMRRANGSLSDLCGKLRTREALAVTRAMAAEARAALRVYDLCVQDLKAGNFLYSATGPNSVEVCISDLGSLKRNGLPITVTTYGWAPGYKPARDARGYNVANEEHVVYQLAWSLASLSAAGASRSLGSAKGRAECLQLDTKDEPAAAAWRAALCYGLQCDGTGALLPNAGSTRANIERFVQLLETAGLDETPPTARPGEDAELEDAIAWLRGPARHSSRVGRAIDAEYIDTLCSFPAAALVEAFERTLAPVAIAALRAAPDKEKILSAALGADRYVPPSERESLRTWLASLPDALEGPASERSVRQDSAAPAAAEDATALEKETIPEPVPTPASVPKEVLEHSVPKGDGLDAAVRAAKKTAGSSGEEAARLIDAVSRFKIAQLLDWADKNNVNTATVRRNKEKVLRAILGESYVPAERRALLLR